MKNLILLCILSGFLAMSVKAQAIIITNEPDISVTTALSNLMVNFGQLKSEIESAKSNSAALSTIQTVTYSNGIPVATNTVAAPVVTGSKVNSWLDSIIGILATLGGLLAALAGFARTLRKIIPDAAQVNYAGVLLATLGFEINPSKAKLAAAAAAPQQPIPANLPKT
jgi:hypothetical protein